MNISTLSSVDFYVSVIDNYGDMGFAVNLALSLHEKYPALHIRFFSDDSTLFRKFFREGVPEWIGYVSLDVLESGNPPAPSALVCNFFDRPLPRVYLARFPYQKTIVSFSYFLLHEGLESLHGTSYTLESGYDKVIHFVPSLLSGGGGVIINPEIEERKEEVLKGLRIEAREKFILKCHPELVSALKDCLRGRSSTSSIISEINRKIPDRSPGWQVKYICEKKWVSVFVYSETVESILEATGHADKNTVFFIFWTDFSYLTGRNSENIVWMPFLSLIDYGVFQSLCDANIVRGENSLCQGLISGKPVLWDIYKESNGAHEAKIEDYLAFLSKHFPETDWTEYGRIMQGFNNPENKTQAFSDFVTWFTKYEKVFEDISEYVQRKCNLVEKLEEILEK